MMNRKYMAILLGATMGLSSMSAIAAPTVQKAGVKTEASATANNNKKADSKKAESKKAESKKVNAKAGTKAAAEKTDKCFLGQIVKTEKEADGSVKVSLKVVKTGEKETFELTDNAVELTLAKTVNVQKEKEEKKDDKAAAKKDDKTAAKTDEKADAKADEKADAKADAKVDAKADTKADDKKATADTKAATEKTTENAAKTNDKTAKTAEKKDDKKADKKTPDLKAVLTSAEKELDVKAAEEILKTVMEKGSSDDLKEGTVVLISFKEADASITDVRVLTTIKVEDKKADQKTDKAADKKDQNKTTEKATDNKDVKAKG